jgi:flagellar assembly protein FliH
LSKVIKSSFANAEEGAKTIAIRQVNHTIPFDSFELDVLNEDIIEGSDTNEIQNEVNAILQQAKEEAEQIVGQAVQEANLIKEQIEIDREQAFEEINHLREQAIQEGHAEGFHKGETDALNQYEGIIEEAQEVVHTSKRDYLEAIEKAEPIIIDLAIGISRKIIGQTIEENNEAWISLTKKAIEEVREYEEVKMYVHPNWYERTLYQKEELLSILSRSQELYIYPDSKISEFSCLIETPFGRVDASIDSQLEQVKIQLHEKLKEGSNERS